MGNNFLREILDSPKFWFYSKLISAAITGGAFVLFICNNQINYLKERNDDLKENYELNRDLDRKKCENEQDELRITLKKSLDHQYKKFEKNSKEATLFLETYEIIKEVKGR